MPVPFFVLSGKRIKYKIDVFLAKIGKGKRKYM